MKLRECDKNGYEGQEVHDICPLCHRQFLVVFICGGNGVGAWEMDVTECLRCEATITMGDLQGTL